MKREEIVKQMADQLTNRFLTKSEIKRSDCAAAAEECMIIMEESSANRKGDYSQPRMKFGKYKDILISDINSGYLKWCLKNVTFKSSKVKEEIELDLLRRESEDEDLENYQDDPDDIPF